MNEFFEWISSSDELSKFALKWNAPQVWRDAECDSRGDLSFLSRLTPNETNPGAFHPKIRH